MTHSNKAGHKDDGKGPNKDMYYLLPEWRSKPVNVHACTTLCACNANAILDSDTIEDSTCSDYGGFNLASHVGDDLQAVEANRLKLATDLCLPSTPVWLDQVHSNKVIHADNKTHTQQDLPQADASVATTSKVVCAVLTADCLPVFFCNQSGTEVAVAHAGWRGLHAGILRKTVESMSSATDEIFAYLGPAIGSQSFEVGEEVFQSFVEKNRNNQTAFISNKEGHYLCDIYQLARIELQLMGVNHIDGGGVCTYSDSRFYSYRRQSVTGRMASLIWFE